MIKEEFERYYADNSLMTVEDLHGHGLFAIPCDCVEEGCQGWKIDWETRANEILAKYGLKPVRGE